MPTPTLPKSKRKGWKFLPRVPVPAVFLEAAALHGQDPWQLLIDLATDFGRNPPAILIIKRQPAARRQ